MLFSEDMVWFPNNKKFRIVWGQTDTGCLNWLFYLSLGKWSHRYFPILPWLVYFFHLGDRVPNALSVSLSHVVKPFFHEHCRPHLQIERQGQKALILRVKSRLNSPNAMYSHQISHNLWGQPNNSLEFLKRRTWKKSLLFSWIYKSLVWSWIESCLPCHF